MPDAKDVAGWIAHEEPADAPRLVGQRMNDLVAATLSVRIRVGDVVPDVDGDDRVLRT